MVASHLIRLALATRTVTKQCEANGVQNRSLARAGRTVNQKERFLSQQTEINNLLPCKRPKSLHLDF
jgi:hypothetical protein